jgi:hypothetical protein
MFPGGLLWLSMLFSWVHVFKIFHISKTDERVVHEVANNKYSAIAFIIADTFSVGTLTVLFFPLIPLAYFMMGFPAKAFPFVVLNLWVVRV